VKLKPELEDYQQQLLNLTFIRFDELPDFGLYSDQVIAIIEKQLSFLNATQEERIITPAMINNYVKLQLIDKPERKKYYKTHIAQLIVITLLKQVLPLSEVKKGLELQVSIRGFQIAFDTFCQELEESVYTEVTAPFTGKVVIPEEKKADVPVLTLISENFYVAGTVNEKDLEKVTIGQVADITVVSSNFTTVGKVSFVDTTPANTVSDPYTQGSSMSSYPVKLSFDSLERIVNGYHVQATINLEENQVVVPKVAIRTDGDVTYVLVNDFGTVTRRVIQTTEEAAEGIVVTSGLEAQDEIIVSSEADVQEGDLLDPASMEVDLEEE